MEHINFRNAHVGWRVPCYILPLLLSLTAVQRPSYKWLNCENIQYKQLSRVTSWDADLAFLRPSYPLEIVEFAFPNLIYTDDLAIQHFSDDSAASADQASAWFRSGSDFKNTLTQKGLDLRPPLTQDDASTSKWGIRGDLVHPLQHTLQWVPNGQFTTRNIISGSLIDGWWMIGQWLEHPNCHL